MDSVQNAASASCLRKEASPISAVSQQMSLDSLQHGHLGNRTAHDPQIFIHIMSSYPPNRISLSCPFRHTKTPLPRDWHHLFRCQGLRICKASPWTTDQSFTFSFGCNYRCSAAQPLCLLFLSKMKCSSLVNYVAFGLDFRFHVLILLYFR